MARHHFVPQCILKNWEFETSNGHFWTLYKAYPSKFHPRSAIQVMYEDDGNTLRLPEHPVSRGILFHALGRLLGEPSPPDDSFDDLITLGNSEYPYKPDMIEHQLTEVDDRIARKVRKLRSDRSPLDEDEKDLLVGVALHARTRGPLWRDNYSTRTLGRALPPSYDLPAGSPIAKDLEALGLTNEQVLRPIEPFYRLFSLLDPFKEGRENLQIGLRVSVLHAPPEVGFVTCDNPSRPFVASTLESDFDKDLPGFRVVGTAMVYPLAPDHCVYVSAYHHFADGGHENVDAARVRRINTALLIAAQKEIVVPVGSHEVFEAWAVEKLLAGSLPPLVRP